MTSTIRAGIGGWTYEPWRETFYPPKHPKARELEYASSKVTAIEINGTYYSTQKPATWADWAKRTPQDFVFAARQLRQRQRAAIVGTINGDASAGLALPLDELSR